MDELRGEHQVARTEAFRSEQRSGHVPKEFGVPTSGQDHQRSETLSGWARLSDQVVRAGLSFDNLAGNVHGPDR